MKKLFLFLFFSCSLLKAELNEFRAVNFQRGTFDDAFIQKAIDAGYNYIIREFSFDEDAVDPMADIHRQIESTLDIIGSDCDKIQLIPKVYCLGGWAKHWLYLRDAATAAGGVDYDFEMNLIWGRNRSGNIKQWGQPACADPDFLTAFDALLDTIANAYNTSTSYNRNLAYMDIGGAEPKFYDYFHFGGYENGAKVDWQTNGYRIYDTGETFTDNAGNTIVATREFSTTERTEINAMGNVGNSAGMSSAIQRLYTDYINTLVLRVTNEFPSSNALIYSDAFDQCHNGGREYFTYNGTLATTSGIIDLPGLSDAEKEELKNRLVLMPWSDLGSLEGSFTHRERTDFKTYEVFRSYSDRNFKFVYNHSLVECSDAGIEEQHEMDRILQLREFQATARSFDQNCLGYYVAQWGCSWGEAAHTEAFNTMERFVEEERRIKRR